MTKDIGGRPEEFGEEKRRAFVGMVEMGMSRRQAAIHLGISPSTVTKRMARDADFAGSVRTASRFHEFDLLHRMHRLSYRSWRGCAWLLERAYPHMYCKAHRKDGKLGPGLDEVFDAVLGALREELPAEMYQRVERRLDEVAARQFGDVPYPVPSGAEEMESVGDGEIEGAGEGASGGAGESEMETERPGDGETERLGEEECGSALDEPEEQSPSRGGYGGQREPSLVSQMLEKSEALEKQHREEEEMRRYQQRLVRRQERKRCRQNFHGGTYKQVAETQAGWREEEEWRRQAAVRLDGQPGCAVGEPGVAETERQRDGETQRAGNSGIEALGHSNSVRHSDIRHSSFPERGFFNTGPDPHEKRVLKNIGG